MSQRFLTKSRFKVGHECPTKLFYWGKPEYGNNNANNAFLKALAEGGFQVGELAKIYHPNGVEVRALKIEDAVKETEELLKKDSITLFEPAIQIGDYLVRVDILVKTRNTFEVIEVKAKSFDPREERPFFKKRSKNGIREISSSWEPYLIDVAFQASVLKKRFPKATVSSYLMLADKSKKASIDGLNQKFLLASGDSKGARVVISKGTSKESLGEPLLVKVNVDSEVKCDLGRTVFKQSFFRRIRPVSCQRLRF